MIHQYELRIAIATTTEPEFLEALVDLYNVLLEDRSYEHAASILEDFLEGCAVTAAVHYPAAAAEMQAVLERERRLWFQSMLPTPTGWRLLNGEPAHN